MKFRIKKRIRSEIDYSHINNINFRNNFIFIHIPKNAGTSIYRSFGMLRSYHYTSNEYENMLGSREFQNFFKFCFVRNPFDRFLSLYHYARLDNSYYHSSTNPEKAIYGKHMDYDKLKNASLRECAELLVSDKLEHNPPHVQWRPQVEWILNENGEVNLDYIGRVEDLQFHYNNICRIIGLPSQNLEKTNKSGKEDDYRLFFDNITREIVESYYKSDLELFKYKF